MKKQFLISFISCFFSTYFVFSFVNWHLNFLSFVDKEARAGFLLLWFISFVLVFLVLCVLRDEDFSSSVSK